MLGFVAEAWAPVPEGTVARSSRGCGISNTLDHSREGDLHCRLADVEARAPEDWGVLQAKCCELFFGTDSGESFDGFESDD